MTGIQAARIALPPLIAGVLIALSLPPWGWWPLAFVGFAWLYRAIEDVGPARRALLGWITGLGIYGVGLFWMSEFTLPGSVVAVFLSALYVALAALVVPATGAGRASAFPAAVVLTEALRQTWPFEGLPLAGSALGQAGGPLSGAARISGSLVLVALAATAGVCIVEAARARWVPAFAAAAVVVALPAVAWAVGVPERIGGIDVALVQGGGPRGFRAVDTNPTEVYERHADASTNLKPPLDLVVWPEDVIDIDGDIASDPIAAEMAALARRVQSTVVAGVVEGEGSDNFRNKAVAWDQTGGIADEYEKVRRVPFGEYVPMRSFIDKVADLSAVPRDAIAGEGPGVLNTRNADLGVLVSYEVFFADRGRAAVRAGAELILVPTNAASFKTTQVPTQQVAAARLRAIETGRDVVQAGPTGYGAFVRATGDVVERTVLGRQQVEARRMGLRRGLTPYARTGDAPLLVLATLALALPWRAAVVARPDAGAPVA